MTYDCDRDHESDLNFYKVLCFGSRGFFSVSPHSFSPHSWSEGDILRSFSGITENGDCYFSEFPEFGRIFQSNDYLGLNLITSKALARIISGGWMEDKVAWESSAERRIRYSSRLSGMTVEIISQLLFE